MNAQLAPAFITKLKKQNIRTRKSFKKAFEQFTKDSNASSLNNHALKRDWEGYRSIDINSDYRAVFEEVDDGEEKYAYFVTLGTHQELYKPPKSN